MSEYVANGGQAYFLIQENVNVDFMPFQRLAKPKPLLKPLELSEPYLKNGFVLSSQNVYCCLKVERTENGTFRYVSKNGPVRLEEQK